MKKNILWDFDGTIARLPGLWSGTMKVVLKDVYNVVADSEIIKAHFSSGFPWHRPEKLHDALGAEEWWDNIKPILYQAAHACGVDDDNLMQHFRNTFLDVKRWEITPNIEDVLQLVKDNGGSNYILSNHVPELPELVRDLELDTYFDEIISSGNTGIEKPNPACFDRVVELAQNNNPDDYLMIGDSVSADFGFASSQNIKCIIVGVQAPSSSRYLTARNMLDLHPEIEAFLGLH
ncbi:putative hydrolase of the HAD superfamily [Pseudovibrio denitrificans]|uniref:Putative hydrolase of the HAD superfamily n=1 Tax=Pseudovibrio denitrificans TaxID=258256 RepID=A0A1I7DGL9_9HYPH|nr:HAD family hydrolase [Pseudovibrio denitrificans]SFU10818.1 putative hydrolase of the HAD superfamily [Pseudovibrio denitrificans]